jgi:hypothetical protein
VEENGLRMGPSIVQVWYIVICVEFGSLKDFDGLRGIDKRALVVERDLQFSPSHLLWRRLWGSRHGDPPNFKVTHYPNTAPFV